MKFEKSKINPLKRFLQSIVDFPEEYISLNPLNLRLMGNHFSSGGLIFETDEEVIKGLKVLSEMQLVEINDNKLRITEYGKAAL